MRGLSTHLGNGIASPLPRHPNPIWEQAGIDELSASFIADGHHLDLATLRVCACKGPVADHPGQRRQPARRTPPAIYGEWAVDPSGKIVVAGTPYLAGSNQRLDVGVHNLLDATGWSLGWLHRHGDDQPGDLARSQAPGWRRASRPNLVLLRQTEDLGLQLVDCCIEGAWTRA